MLHRNSLCRQLNRGRAPHENFDYPINFGRVLSDLSGKHGGPPFDQNRMRTDGLSFPFRSLPMLNPIPEIEYAIGRATNGGAKGKT